MTLCIGRPVRWGLCAQYPDAGHAAILQHSLTNAAIIADFLDGLPIPPNSSVYNVLTASPSGTTA